MKKTELNELVSFVVLDTILETFNPNWNVDLFRNKQPVIKIDEPTAVPIIKKTILSLFPSHPELVSGLKVGQVFAFPSTKSYIDFLKNLQQTNISATAFRILT